MSSASCADSDALTVTQLHASDVRIYKALAGSDPSLKAYNDECVASHDDRVELQRREWRALYTQFQREHVLGTVPYRWDHGLTEAAVVAVTFEALDVVVLDGRIFHDGSVSGAEKATAVKAALGIDAAAPLMEALGAQRKVALVRETATEWELVIPHGLLARLRASERVVARFKRHAQLPITRSWCEEGGAWEPWVDGCEPV